jgi:hypothetical protein
MNRFETEPLSKNESEKITIDMATIAEHCNQLRDAVENQAHPDEIRDCYEEAETMLQQIQNDNKRVSPGIDELYFAYRDVAKVILKVQPAVYFDTDPNDDLRIMLPNPHIHSDNLTKTAH